MIESASWYLLNAISSMRDDQGRILIDGIYEKIVQPNEREMDLIETYAIENADSLRKIYGLKLPVLESDRRAFLKTYYFEPALSIEGISTGYQGQELRPFYQPQARAKMEMRLVPGLTPEYVWSVSRLTSKKKDLTVSR